MGPDTKIRINGTLGIYEAPRRHHGPLEHAVNTEEIGRMKGTCITIHYWDICMCYISPPKEIS